MMVVRLPDSPTEYGHRSVSPQTTSTCDSGTPSSSAAIIPIVVLAPPPTSVTPTKTRVAAFGIDAQHGAAPAQSRAEHHERHAGAALDGSAVGARHRTPARLPVEQLGAAADALVERVVGEGDARPRLASCSSSRTSTGSISSLNATSSIIDSMPKKPWGSEARGNFPRRCGSCRRDRRSIVDVRAVVQLEAADRPGVLAIAGPCRCSRAAEWR